MVFGSLLNGTFESDASDLDLSIFVDEDSFRDHLQILQKVKRVLERQNRKNPLGFEYVVTEPFWQKAGANLKFKVQFSSKVHSGVNTIAQEIECDLLVNRHLELCNSHLLRQYCLLDKRFREAVLVLKRWNRESTTEKIERLNSFSICLLLLALMIKEGYLPNLQQ